MIVLGSGALQRADSGALLSLATRLAKQVKDKNLPQNSAKLCNSNEYF